MVVVIAVIYAFGFTVTVLVALVVVHSPVAVAVIVADPVKAASQSITPVDALITPAEAGDTLYTIVIAPGAVAVYFSSTAS
jgi:hypothetical protein